MAGNCKGVKIATGIIGIADNLRKAQAAIGITIGVAGNFNSAETVIGIAIEIACNLKGREMPAASRAQKQL